MLEFLAISHAGDDPHDAARLRDLWVRYELDRAELLDGSRASEAGIRHGDVIMHIARYSVRTPCSTRSSSAGAKTC